MKLPQMHNHSTCQIEAFIDLALDLLGVHVAPPVTTPEQ
jgi:hypothetical protein